MVINDIYRSKLLKYPLTSEEYKELDNAFEFLEIFKKKFIFLSDYRRHLVNSVRDKYSVEQFYFYETIISKLFWNLRWLIFPLWMDKDISKEELNETIKNNYNNRKNLPKSLLLCHFQEYYSEEGLRIMLAKSDIFNDNFYRSFINKLIIVDRTNGKLITKPIEGSSHIFYKNYFNLYTSTLLFDRSEYEEIMKDPFKIRNRKVIMPEFYYEHDYGFPNLNYCKFKIGNSNEELRRIEKMYYSKQKYKYWFKIIK